MALLRVEGVRKAYGSLEVLKGIDLDIHAGEVVAIVGASGAGKSTLLHIMGTLDKPDQGRVTMKGVDLFGLSEKALAELRNKEIGFIFQFHNLLPEFTALENVYMPALIGKFKDEAKLKARALELLQTLGLEARANHFPSQMSGGEQQRVAVARALMNAPAIIFADEPSGNLDSHNAEELHRLFFKLKDDLGHTFVIITHNEQLAEMADRRLVMKDGLLVNS